MTKISGLILTYNEEEHINDLIDNISFVDEIIVVDSFSNDDTLKKLKQFNHVTVIQREFENFTDQRNFIIKKAQYNWILFIDADERITPKLKIEILETIKTNTNIAAFMFRRKFFFNKKPIHFSGFQTDTTYRLFKNGHVSYDIDKKVHEMPIIKGESAILKNRMLHYFINNSSDYKEKMERYAKLKALELFNKGKKASIFHFIFRPIYKFVVNYFFRLGFLDGTEGFQLSYLSAYGVYYRYCELKKLVKLSPKH